MPVSLYGQSAEMRALRAIADRYGLWLIEDAAQAIGARHYEEPIGAYAHAATLSFFPTKNIGAAGDAGMILTSDEQIAYKARSLRVHGMNGGYYYEDIGYTARLDELQAVLLRAKMRHLHDWTERRRYHATLYRALLADAPLQLPVVRPYNYHVYHQFTVRTAQRDALREFLRAASKARSTTRCRCTCSPRIGSWATARATARMRNAPRRKCSRCRFIRS